MLRGTAQALCRSCAKTRPSQFIARGYLTEGAPVIGTRPDTQDPGFQENDRRMSKLVAELKEKVEKIVQGGGPKAVERHTSRGKLVARERINLLLDPGSPFLELSQLAGYNLYGREEVPAGGIVAGVGRVSGVLCIIVANDATVKGGSYYPITVTKHLRAQKNCHGK